MNMNIREITELALESMMDRIDSAMPDIGDNHSILKTEPLRDKYVHGCIDTAIAIIQILTGWMMEDLYSTIQVVDEIKQLYPYRLKRSKAMAARRVEPKEDSLSLHSIVSRMMERLTASGALNEQQQTV